MDAVRADELDTESAPEQGFFGQNGAARRRRGVRGGLGTPRPRPGTAFPVWEGAHRAPIACTWERSFAELRDAYRIAVHGTPSELATRLAA
jgi:hypothetical protein